MVSVSNGDGVPYCGFDSLPDDLLLRVLWCLDGTAECVRSAALSRRFFVLALSPSLYSRLELAACGPRFGAADLRRLCLRAGAGLRALSPPPHLSVVAVLAALRGEPGTSLDELSFLPADPADEQHFTAADAAALRSLAPRLRCLRCHLRCRWDALAALALPPAGDVRLQLAGGALRPGGLRLPLGPLFPALLALPAVTSASLFSQRLGDADAAALAQAALAQAQQAQAAGPGGGGEGGLTLHNRAAPPPPTVASSLASLSLALNDIADGGAEALGGALQAGALPALEVLDVRACHISPRGLALLDPSRWARGEGASRRGVLLADHQI